MYERIMERLKSSINLIWIRRKIVDLQGKQHKFKAIKGKEYNIRNNVMG